MAADAPSDGASAAAQHRVPTRTCPAATRGRPEHRHIASRPIAEASDCSGLVGAAWRSAGVSLPRTVKQMYDAGRKVAKSDLQPGDVIYWYNDNQHNGMYVGNGKAIHAPRTGKNIEIVPLDSMPFFAASRP
ncbi:C40 family peptidase [Streptomyces sp. Root369]|uniref:C40 family peptidase n=1 Tax=Streptomyces sp. Root369 TaxID=1736523 RepID=UPI001F5BA4E5|nr:C40 family peptidase [Streptomyces sp. Root369]